MPHSAEPKMSVPLKKKNIQKFQARMITFLAQLKATKNKQSGLLWDALLLNVKLTQARMLL